MICLEWIYSLGPNSFSQKKNKVETKEFVIFFLVGESQETTGQLGQSDTHTENAFNCEPQPKFHFCSKVLSLKTTNAFLDAEKKANKRQEKGIR